MRSWRKSRLRFAVHRQDAVAVTETHLLPRGAEYVTVGHVARGEVTFAPFPTDADVDDRGEENVHQHAADHDEQALPAGLLRNSSGLGSLFICSVSMLSSIIPASLTYPPKGIQPIP